MDDSSVQDHIEQLVAQEHELLALGEREEGLTPDQHQRLEDTRVQLDRYWDLLRQRRAHEAAGLDPDQTSLRPAETVEDYEQ
jgi:hypothetical protein